MRIRRLAILSGAAAAVAGAMWWKKSKATDEMEEEAVLDLGSSNGGDTPGRQWDKTESELSR